MGIFGFGKKKPASPSPGLGPTTAPEPDATPTPTNPTPTPNPDPTPNTPDPPQNQPPQYQNVGHDNMFNGQTREQWRDDWMGSGNKDRAGTDAWMQQHGAAKLANNGTFMTPFGEALDLGINYGTNNVTPGWTQTGVPNPPMNYSGPINGGGGLDYSGQGTGMDPNMMSAFQQFLSSMNGQGTSQNTQAKPTKTATYNRVKKNPRSMTQTRQA